MRLHQFFRFCLGLALLTGVALATSILGPETQQSLEWITRTSDLVVLGTPVKVDPDVIHQQRVGPVDYGFTEDVTIRVESVLRGQFKGDTLTFRWQTDRARSMKHQVDRGREKNVTYDLKQLFFLNRAPSGAQPEWQGRENMYPRAGIPLANGKLAISAEEVLQSIKNEEALMKRLHVVKPIQRKFERTKPMSWNGAPIIPEVGAVILKDEKRYLTVPAYAHLNKDALTFCASKDYRDREFGAYMLRSYSDEKSISTLKALLKDTGAYVWNPSVDEVCSTYSVRVAAYDTLRDKGIQAKAPVFEECQKRKP